MSRRADLTAPMPLTVLCGLDGRRVGDLGAGLLLRGRRLALIRVDPSPAEQGYVECHVTDSEGRYTRQRFDLDHNCLSCTVRIATVAAVRRLSGTGRYDALLIQLHPGVEASAAVEALDAELVGVARVDTVVLDLLPDWLEQLAGDAELAAIGAQVAPDDNRAVAGVLAAHLDAASVVVVCGWERTASRLETYAALGALCPDARLAYPETLLDLDLATVIRTGAHDPARLRPLTRGGLLSPRSRYLSSRADLRLVRWTSATPLHPQRLHDALDELADGVVRSAGRLWFADRPDVVVGWDSAGERLALGPEGRWPSPMPVAGVSARRPSPGGGYGGRHNLLVFFGDGLDESRIRAVLDDCLLTPAELAAGPVAWAQLPDPFGWGLDDRRGAA